MQLLLTVNWLSAVWALAAVGFYVGVYTVWLKRSSVQNIVIGGAAGAVPPLVGWAAVRGDVDVAPAILFLIVFFWTPPHFWALALCATRTNTPARTCPCSRSSTARPRPSGRS